MGVKSLYATFVAKTSQLMIRNYWGMDDTNNPFRFLDPKVVHDLISKICSIHRRHFLKSSSLRLLLTCGSVTDFELHDLRLEHRGAEEIFQALQTSCENLKSIEIYVFLEKSPQYLGLLLRSSKSLEKILLLAVVASFAAANGILEHHHAPQPYKFGYDIKDKHGEQYRQEEGNGGHAVKGSYGFTDDRGVKRQVDYVADHGGFRAQVKTNEPGTANQNPAAVLMVSDAPYAGGVGLGYGGYNGLGYNNLGYGGYGLGYNNLGYGAVPAVGYGIGYGGYGAGYGGYGLGILGGLGYARYGY